LELATHQHSGAPVTADVIAERRHIPEKFLVHILLQLKRAGIVQSLRGARGGYMLARAPEDITLLDIVQAIDGPVLEALPVRDSGSRDMINAWREVAKGVAEVLRGTTVRNLLDQSAKSAMYYI
jgi:Rrf2 family cysteine metabolism transcriptional repressor